MNISIKAKQVLGKVKVISSKSELHRLLIMSAFAKTESEISFHGELSLDVLASIDCLKQLGADIIVKESEILVTPIKELPKERVKIFCNESGSTLRFMLPLLAVLGISAEISVSGRLKDRPLSPMYELLTEVIDIQLSKSPQKARKFIEEKSTWNELHEYIAQTHKKLGLKKYKNIVSFF